MAPTRLRTPLVCFLLPSALLMSVNSLEKINQDAPEITCSEGLTKCHVSSVPQFAAALPDPSDSVDVTDMKLKVILCCSAPHDCSPCLQIKIEVQVENALDVSEESGDHFDEEESSDTVEVAEGGGRKSRALVRVCLGKPGSIDICKTVEFTPRHSSLHQASHLPTHNKMQMWIKLVLEENLMFGTPVLVNVYSHLNGTNHNQTINVPPLEEVCSVHQNNVKECDAPIVRLVHDLKRNLVLLKLNGTVHTQDKLLCQMLWHDMPVKTLTWPKGKTEMIISSDLVAPCLCFQVWWSGKNVRRELCPFKNQQDAHERMRHNLSVTVVESPMRGGETGLSWNVTAPCRLEAEVWLCKKDVAGSQCEEVAGSRQALNSHEEWRTIHSGLWSKSGEFNATSHPLLCVQMKINVSYLEPQCPFATSRWRWSLIILIGLLLMCLAILGAYFIQGVLKGYVWRWLKDDDVKGAVGGGHVILLYPPDDNKALPGLMCHLGLSLQSLGFTVSLDLWSKAELGALGPVPWLHSRLDQLKRQGGKVVLVLSQAAWIRAEEWGARGWERNTPSRKNKDTKEDEAGKGYPNPSSLPSLDVFSASLSCILADYLQGRAGERFTLVQFESLPPEPPGGFRPLPELFRGLHLYSLPSQSLGFLTELAGTRQVATASARRKRAGGLRMASRTLASGLSSFTAGTTVLRLAGVSQGCVGVREEDSGETVPLQPCLLTPPSSPDTSPKANEMEWL
ncbi:interleukin-17 receptor C isoform X2 [Anabas testudineus]|uniref:SEFIR domain-containing protein n=1 Tax=Anabas testudineus TaxID=64144 RepID=A0A3Q1IL80_ANATE|nr:interleukin-17 receptor C isoform X2 [Anabas testudineus]